MPRKPSLISIGRRLSDEVDRLSFAPPVTHVYNPLRYARRSAEAYLKRYAKGPKEVLFLGMNPGPWGMAQTGVPFGDPEMIRDFLGIEEKVGKPKREHDKRPVLGFASPRSEVSGTRLWGWIRERFGTAERFFERFFILNYCPLIFLEESGRNRVPEKLPAEERAPLMEACDRALLQTVQALSPEWVIGVGKFAEDRAKEVLIKGAGLTLKTGRILHPSPASPAANRGWAPQAEAQLKKLSIRLP